MFTRHLRSRCVRNKHLPNFMNRTHAKRKHFKHTDDSSCPLILNAFQCTIRSHRRNIWENFPLGN